MPETLSTQSLFSRERTNDAKADEAVDVLERQIQLLLDHIDWAAARDEDKSRLAALGPPPPSKPQEMQVRYGRPNWTHLTQPFLPTVSAIQQRDPAFAIDLTIEETRLIESVCRAFGGLPLSDLQPTLDSGRTPSGAGGGAGGATGSSSGPPRAENPVIARQRELVLAKERQATSRLWSFIHQTVFGRLELLTASDFLLAVSQPGAAEVDEDAIHFLRRRYRLGPAHDPLPAPAMSEAQAREAVSAALDGPSRRRRPATSVRRLSDRSD
jgi:hypothetical protein